MLAQQIQNILDGIASPKLERKLLKNIHSLLILEKEDIVQGFEFLELLDAINSLREVLYTSSQGLEISQDIQNPEYLLTKLLQIESAPPWVTQLYDPILAKIYEILIDRPLKDSDPELLVFFDSTIDGVAISAAHFSMGNPQKDAPRTQRPVHQVGLSPFWIGKTEISQALYWNTIQNNPSSFVGMSRPVENLSWLDAVQFCNRLSTRKGFPLCYDICGEEVLWNQEANGFRLPTEAEWEFVARHQQTPSLPLEKQAWWENDWEGKTTAIMQLHPNHLGVYDIIGNVSEWCWDWFGVYSSRKQQDPIGQLQGNSKVHRGGGWNSEERALSAHSRAGLSPYIAIPSIGLRICRTL